MDRDHWKWSPEMKARACQAQAQCLGKKPPFETDPITLARRQKQIDYGKNTAEYENYLKTVPKESRTPKQPKTPDRTKKVSRRAWDGEVRVWRLLLHAYDPAGTGNVTKKHGEWKRNTHFDEFTGAEDFESARS